MGVDLAAGAEAPPGWCAAWSLSDCASTLVEMAAAKARTKTERIGDSRVPDKLRTHFDLRLDVRQGSKPRHAWKSAPDQTRTRSVQRDQVRRDRIAVDAREAHRQPRALRARQPRLVQADHTLTLVAGAQQMTLVLPSATGTLSEGTGGISGMPRQVRNCEPNRLTVGGGTPRRVHSRKSALN